MATARGNEIRRTLQARLLEETIAAHEGAAEVMLREAQDHKDAAEVSTISEFTSHALKVAAILTAQAQIQTSLAEGLKLQRKG